MKKSIFITGIFFFSVCCFGQRTDSKQVQRSEAEFRHLAKSAKEQVTKRTEFENLFDKAILGDFEAMYEVGKSYLLGIHGKQDYEKAFAWIERAAENGVGRAWTRMGTIYKYGVGKSADYQKAYKCFSHAAELNDPDGTFLKGYMQYKGFGCRQSYAGAIEDFQKGVELNSPGSMYMLGLCYRSGFGIEKDADMANYWLKKSADAGYYLASVELMSETPEYDPDAINLVQKVEAAKQISTQIDFPINKFTKIESKVGTEEINGVFDGYLLKYDWNGSVIIDATPVSLDLQLADNIISGTWSEKGREDKLAIKGTLEGEKITFKDMNYRMSDHFHQDEPLTYRFQTAEIDLLKKGDDIFIAANIGIYVPALMEPQKPHTLILVKKSTENTAEPERRISVLTAYPNPFDAKLNIEFSLKEAGRTKLRVTSLDGKLHHHVPGSYLEKGEYIIPLLLDVPSGIYIVTLESGTETRTAKIVKP